MPYLRKQAATPPSVYICTRCKTEKPIAAFPKGSTDTWCRDCHHAYYKENYVPRPKPPKYATEEERRAAVRRNSREWHARNPEVAKAWRDANPSSRRKSKLKTRYGLTEEAFNWLLQSQDGKCAICGTAEPGGYGNQWHIDHCHETNVIRGLLCVKCNQGIGCFRDNPKFLKAAIEYLRKPWPLTGSTGIGVPKGRRVGRSTKERKTPKSTSESFDFTNVVGSVTGTPM